MTNNTIDPVTAGAKADELIAGEIARQDAMWGVSNERADTTSGQLMQAGMAQLDALYERQQGYDGFKNVPDIYPEGWAGFRDYGSDVANLVVAAAFIRQEIKRKIANGEDTTRASRNPQTQPFGTDQPKVLTA